MLIPKNPVQIHVFGGEEMLRQHVLIAVRAMLALTGEDHVVTEVRTVPCEVTIVDRLVSSREVYELIRRMESSVFISSTAFTTIFRWMEDLGMITPGKVPPVMITKLRR